MEEGEGLGKCEGSSSRFQEKTQCRSEVVRKAEEQDFKRGDVVATTNQDN